MSNQEILEKAIQKAIDGGFNPGASENGEPPQQTFTRRMMQDLFFRHAVIFNHDFAKALWGEELHHETFIVPKELNKRFAGTEELAIRPIWQYHLQKMVISDDPIKYLGHNI